MGKNKQKPPVEPAIKPIFKVDRVYSQGQEDVSYYIVALRIGAWTETINVPKPRGWFGLQKSNLVQLHSDIKKAKEKLLAKHSIFAEEFPEVESYGQASIEAEIRQNLEMPKLEEAKTPKSVYGSVVDYN